MNERAKYVSLSRGTNKQNIQIHRQIITKRLLRQKIHSNLDAKMKRAMKMIIEKKRKLTANEDDSQETKKRREE
jgi:hypothetical protein